MIKDNEKISRNIKEAYDAKKYIVCYRTIYQPFYSVNAGYYAHPVYTSHNGNLISAGRFFHMTGEAINQMLGINLLNNL